MARRKTTIAFATDVDECVKEVMMTHDVLFSEALHIIVRKYKDQSDQSLAKEVVELLKKDLTHIRLGTNNADKNSQILIEMLNDLFD